MSITAPNIIKIESDSKNQLFNPRSLPFEELWKHKEKLRQTSNLRIILLIFSFHDFSFKDCDDEEKNKKENSILHSYGIFGKGIQRSIFPLFQHFPVNHTIALDWIPVSCKSLEINVSQAWDKTKFFKFLQFCELETLTLNCTSILIEFFDYLVKKSKLSKMHKKSTLKKLVFIRNFNNDIEGQVLTDNYVKIMNENASFFKNVRILDIADLAVKTELRLTCFPSVEKLCANFFSFGTVKSLPEFFYSFKESVQHIDTYNNKLKTKKISKEETSLFNDFSNFKNLQVLISNRSKNPADELMIINLLDNKNIKKLKISEISKAKEDSFIPKIKNLKKLRNFSFEKEIDNSSMFEKIIKSLDLSLLSNISFEVTNLEDNVIAALKEMTALKKLDFGFRKVNTRKEIEGMPNLKKLRINDKDNETHSYLFEKFLSLHKSLQKLDFTKDGVVKEDLLRALAQNQSISSLTFYGELKIRWRAIAIIFCMKNLQVVNFDRMTNRLDDIEALEDFDIPDKILPEFLEGLESTGEESKLEVVYISCLRGLPNTFFREIAKSKNLRSLEFQRCFLKIANIKEFCSNWKGKNPMDLTITINERYSDSNIILATDLAEIEKNDKRFAISFYDF